MMLPSILCYTDLGQTQNVVAIWNVFYRPWSGPIFCCDLECVIPTLVKPNKLFASRMCDTDLGQTQYKGDSVCTIIFFETFSNRQTQKSLQKKSEPQKPWNVIFSLWPRKLSDWWSRQKSQHILREYWRAYAVWLRCPCTDTNIFAISEITTSREQHLKKKRFSNGFHRSRIENPQKNTSWP